MTKTVYSPAFNVMALRNARECPTVEVWRRNEDSVRAMGREVYYVGTYPGVGEAALEAIADSLEPEMRFRTVIEP